jgi:hypothetical protein
VFLGRVTVAILVLLGLVTACSVSQDPGVSEDSRTGGMSRESVDSGNFPDLYCPESGSREAERAEPGDSLVISGQRSEPALVISGGATVHIAPSGDMSGDVVICGGGATLIVEGKFTGRAHIQGGGPRLILVDGVEAPRHHLMGGGPEVITCYEREPANGREPCTRYF